MVFVDVVDIRFFFFDFIILDLYILVGLVFFRFFGYMNAIVLLFFFCSWVLFGFGLGCVFKDENVGFLREFKISGVFYRVIFFCRGYFF